MAQIQKKFIADSAIDENKIASSALSSTGALAGGSGTKLSVKVDSSTIDINGSDQIEVKAGGITNTQVSASAAIDYSKLALSNSIVDADVNSAAAIAYSKLALSNSIVNADIASAAAIAYSKLALAASVQASDMDSGAATAGQVLTADGLGAASYVTPSAMAIDTEDIITLNSTDITNQYVDLAHPATGASASINSIQLSVVGGPEQLKVVDYTVSLTGGVAGVTRITFAGDLATAGAAELISGDILMIGYSY